jgi:RNase P/RNase MRP subunit p30
LEKEDDEIWEIKVARRIKLNLKNRKKQKKTKKRLKNKDYREISCNLDED